MELKDAIERRTSVRHFRNEPVPPEDLREIVRLAAMAPSVNNYQPWKFMIIVNKDLMGKMATAVSRKISELPSNDSIAAANIKSQVEFFATFFREAPALIVLLMEEYESVLEKGVQIQHDEINRIRNYPDFQSAGACIQNILLAAVSMNYGACWLSAPLIARDELTEILDVKSPFQIVSMVAIGIPLKNPVPKGKKDLDELIEWRD